MSTTSDLSRFRSEFPIFDRVAYLNSGTAGPVPRRAAAAVEQRVQGEMTDGRAGRAYFDALIELAARVRSGYAGALGCGEAEVALTGSTTDGVNTVLSGLEIGRGDQVLTSDEEHPGLLAPLGRARRGRGITVRVSPFEELAENVSSETRLIACSHVSWVSGQVADVQRLVATGVPVLLDGAQALGAIPVNVGELGCQFYAASGQKWLCGPEGSGCLFVAADRLDELLIPWPGYGSLADPHRALELVPAEGARRLDHGFPSGIRSAWTLASLELLEETGWQLIHERATSLAAFLADRLKQRGLDVRSRGRSTLVSWAAPDPEEEVPRLAAAGFIVRSIPAFALVRASVGAWSTEEELEALAEAAVNR